MRALIAALAPLFALVAAPALAQDAGTPPDPQTLSDKLGEDRITAGVGAVLLTDYEGSNDYNFVPAPAAIGSYKGYAFQLVGNRLSVDLIRNEPGPVWDVQAGPLGVVNFSRTSIGNINSNSGIKDRRVKALGELDTAIELGGYVGIGKTGVVTSPYDSFSATISYRHDVAGAHGSYILQPSVSYQTPLSRKALVGLFASAERAGSGYARYYFDVDARGSTLSGLPAYNARGGWKNWTLGVLGTYSLTGDLLNGFKVVAGGTYRKLLNDFAASPVTSVAGSRNQWLGAVGIAYTF